MRGKKWTPEEDRILKAYYRGGVKNNWIIVQRKLRARGFERNHKGINARAFALGVSLKTGRGGGHKGPGKGHKIGAIVPMMQRKLKVYKIKTAEGWKCYARYMLKKAGVEIPPRHCILYKDGNGLNCTLENIEIVSYSERQRRNINKFNARQKELSKIPASEKLAAGLRPKEFNYKQYKRIFWVNK